MSKAITIYFGKRGCLTNGDVIKALFPNQPIYEQRNVAIFYGENMRFDPTWWDTPYKENKNES